MIMSRAKANLAGLFLLVTAQQAHAQLPNVNGLRAGPEFNHSVSINGRQVTVPIDCNTLSERDDAGRPIITASGARTLAPTDRNQAFLWQFERAFAHAGDQVRGQYPSARVFYNHLTIGHGVSPQSISSAITRCNTLYFGRR